MRGRPLMVLGTGSHVGKSILTAALGRILSDDGLRVAPFKAQNMSLNSAATPDGLEIGRAQALQTEACRTVACAEMNPVLIKPSTDRSSQVVVLGRVWGQLNVSDYYQRRVEELFPIVVSAFRALAADYDLVLLEGAGSPAEINLKSRDIANMRMAQATGAGCLLVGDIDRGGVFAGLLGTLELLEREERSHVEAFVINKFRGELSLLEPGIKMIEDRLRIPCAGVVPYLHSLGLDEEDSVAMEQYARAAPWAVDVENSLDRSLRIGVIALPHLANFTDFDALAEEPSVAVRYLRKAEDIVAADVVIIPGTKQTLEDMRWLQDCGFVAAIETWKAARNRSAILIGITCAVFVPAFAEYRRACESCGIHTYTIRLDEADSFRIRRATVQGVLRTYKPEMLIINNPHNPSGRLMCADEMRELAHEAAAAGPVVLIDEAFIDYTPEHQITAFAAEQPGIIAVRSLTKFYGCPGLRIGYAVAHTHIARRIEQQMPAWPIGSLALETLSAAVQDVAYAASSIAETARERAWLAAALAGLGLHSYEASANFLLVKLPQCWPESGEVRWQLLKHFRILVRDCASFEGLESGCFIRTAVLSRDQNCWLVDALSCLKKAAR